LSLALSIFVFRKKIVKELIEVSVSAIMPSAHAQTTGRSADNPLQLQPIESDFATITPIPGLLGLELQSKLGELPELCSDIVTPMYLSAFILADINDENFYLKMNQCLRKDMTQKEWVLNYGAIQIPLSKEDKLLIDQVWTKLKETPLNLGTEKLNLSKTTELLNALDGREDLYTLIAKSFLYSSLGNLGQADKLMKSYLSRSSIHKFFFLEYPYADAKKIRKHLIEMLLALEERFKESKLFKSFLLKLYSEASEKFKEELEDELDVPNGSSELASIYNSPNFGPKYPLAWMEQAFSNLDSKAFNKAVNSIEIDKNLDTLSSLQIHLPESKERRSNFYKKFIELENSSEPWHKALYFEILGNKDWLRYFSSKKKDGFTPFFKEKREFYKTNTANNIGILFSIYNLYQMGDLQREYFLKLLAIRSHGLPSTQILPL
tara:strand:+ start:336784 stop:338088 length:1305 start_codon:yes stop_codon:yes gene_type:complete